MLYQLSYTRGPTVYGQPSGLRTPSAFGRHARPGHRAGRMVGEGFEPS